MVRLAVHSTHGLKYRNATVSALSFLKVNINRRLPLSDTVVRVFALVGQGVGVRLNPTRLNSPGSR